MSEFREVKRASITGRPRTLTDEQAVLILRWHEAVLLWKAQRPPTLRQLARDLGTTPGAVYNVVRRGGEYKQASPSTKTRE